MRTLSRFHTKLLLYKEWIKRWRTWPVKEWLEAAQHYRAARYDQAQELYKKGLAAHPTSPARINALLDLSHCAFRLKNFDQAETSLREAVAVNPRERETYVRLARLQLWLGYATEAAWTMRECLSKVSVDPELVTIFITAVVESGGVSYLVDEARDALNLLHYELEAYPRLEVARVRLELLTAEAESARDELAKLASLDRGPFDAVVAYAQLLLDEGKTAYARHHLHRALIVSSENPRVLRLLANSYLKEGVFFEPEYAVQLATAACQCTGWKGIHEMHALAEAYALSGDKMSALLIATKAKDTGGRLLGSYRDAKHLDNLIQRLSEGTQA
jgi:predicted Zn-dependent protease